MSEVGSAAAVHFAAAGPTDSARISEELRASEARYRSLFENARHGIAHCKILFEGDVPRDFVYLEVNGAFEQLTGLRDVAGRRVTEVIPGIRQSNQELLDIYGRVARTGAPETFETHVESLGIWLSISVFCPERDHFVAIFDDITDRKRAAEELRQSDERLRALLERVDILALILSNSGRVLFCNEAFLRLAGRSRADVVGQSYFSLFVPLEIRPDLRRTFDDAIRTGEIPGRYVNEILGRGGERRLVHWANVVLREAGAVSGMASLGEDVSESRRAAQKLAESNRDLRALSARLESIREEERTRIAREVHDEIGQALTALKMDVAWLRRRSGAAPDVAKRLERMSALIDDTVESVRRISTELRPGILDDLGLCAAIQWLARDFQTRSGIPVTASELPLEPALPRERAIGVFRIVQEALTNVVRHACASRVEIVCHDERGELILEVQDDGRGIDPAAIAEPKSIGLIGMRERARLIGGTLELVGAPWKGTIVRLRVPLT